VIQTVNTSLLYLLLSKSTFHSIHLSEPNALYRIAGQTVLGLAVLYGAIAVNLGGEGLYLGMILIWACPFLLLLWYVQVPRLLIYTDPDQEPGVPVLDQTSSHQYATSNRLVNPPSVDS
jgi:hypothetical protein